MVNCEICNTQHGRWNLWTTGSQYVCYNCVVDHKAGFCSNCEEWFPAKLMSIVHQNNGLCTKCAEQGHKIRKQRSGNPEFEFFKMPGERTKLYLGIELETGVPYYTHRHDHVKEYDIDWFLKRLPDNLWPKHDCSIQDSSRIEEDLEIVSQPATFKWLKANPEWDTVLNWRRNGLKSWTTETCGMHIHLDKRAFRDTNHMLRFGQFIFDNRSFSKLISGRTTRQMGWCRLDAWRSYERQVLNNTDTHAYSAVSFRTHTIEVRLFRGTLMPVTFWKNVEFTHALFHATKTKLPTLAEFLKYVSRRKDCPNFKTWMRENNRLERLTCQTASSVAAS